MPILIVIIAVFVVIAFALGGDWIGSDEGSLLALISVIVIVFFVLFLLPYLQDLNRSEATKERLRQLQKNAPVITLKFSMISVALACLAVWWFRQEPNKTVSVPMLQTIGSTAPASAPVSEPVSATVSAAEPEAAPGVVPGAEAEARLFVEDWAQAWSEGNFEKYLAAYSPSFAPADGASRKSWETQRRQRVVKGRVIVVKLSQIQFESLAVDRAILMFEQQYSARGIADFSKKTLQLQRVEGRWRIVREIAVPLPKPN